MICYLLTEEMDSDFQVLGAYETIQDLKREAYQMICVEKIVRTLYVKRVDTKSHNVRGIGCIFWMNFYDDVELTQEEIERNSFLFYATLREKVPTETTSPPLFNEYDPSNRYKQVLISKELIEAWISRYEVQFSDFMKAGK